MSGSNFHTNNRPQTQALIQALMSLLAVIVTGLSLAAVPHKLAEEVSLGWTEWGPSQTQAAWDALGVSMQSFSQLLTLASIAVPFVYIGLALFLIWKKPGERMAVMVAGIFLMFSPGSALNELKDAYPLAEAAGNVMDVISTSLTFLVFVTFPDGKIYPRWSGVVLLIAIVIQGYRLFFPEVYSQNFTFLIGPTLLLSAAAQLQRYLLQPDPINRQQIKWVVFFFIAAFGLLGGFMVILQLVPALRQPTPAGVIAFVAGNLIWLGFMIMFPVTFIIAILKSHLWDIDLIVRRTIIYSLVTLLLGGFYLGSVTLLQNVFATATGQSSPASIVLSTLAIASLFNPLRRRVQDFIDRSFYRRKYNAEQALADFAKLSTHETDLEELSEMMLTVIGSTLQPTTASLWLKGRS